VNGHEAMAAAANKANQDPAARDRSIAASAQARERLAALARVRDVIDEELRACPVERIGALYVLAFRITNAVMDKETGK